MGAFLFSGSYLADSNLWLELVVVRQVTRLAVQSAGPAAGFPLILRNWYDRGDTFLIARFFFNENCSPNTRGQSSGLGKYFRMQLYKRVTVVDSNDKPLQWEKQIMKRAIDRRKILPEEIDADAGQKTQIWG